MKQEGLLERVPFGATFDLDGWASLISQLLADHGFMILERETEEESDFFIGRVLKTTKSTVRGHFFSGAGKWAKAPEKLKFSDLTCCQVGTNYLNVYQRHFERHRAEKRVLHPTPRRQPDLEEDVGVVAAAIGDALYDRDFVVDALDEVGAERESAVRQMPGR